MGKLSTNGLQFGDTFGRNAELSTIKDAYGRSFSGESELVTIFGQSGTGKSLLAYEFGDYVVSGGGIFMCGKFDQLRQGKPFNALASALNNCCGMLLRSNALLTQQLIKGVNSVLGREAYHLAKLIPNLSFILGIDVTNHVNQDEDDCSNGQKRLQYLLCQFVQVLSSVFGSSVVLFLDDLQWADPASIEAVNQLLLTDSLSSINAHFFFLGCYREGEDNNCNSLWKEICSGDVLHAGSTNVKLDYMDEETVNLVISESCTYFRGGPLRPSLIQRRWEWDIEKIESQKLPENVAMFLTNSIGALSEDVKSSLSIISCFGASVEKPFVLVLERALNKSLINNFDTAVDEGLLDKVDDQYRFSHDRIQEAAYNMILEAVQDMSQTAVASLNLRAGKKAMEMSYFDHGITFLPRLPEAVEKGLDILSKLDIGLHLEKVNPEASAKVTKDLLAAHPVLKLMGADEDMTFLAVEQHILGLGSNESISRVTYNYKAFVSFMFRCYDDVKFYIEKVYACRDNSWATLFYAHSGEAFSVGLINFWLARKERKKHQQWFMRGSENKLALKRWTQSCQWTFEAKWYLLEAEEAFCNHDYEAAKPFYEKAMLSAYQHKFVNDEALACELAANFYLHLKENDKAVHLFSLAYQYQCYHDWGAYGKCKSLSEYVESHLNRKLDMNVRRGESTDSSAPSLQQSK
ncbi:putative AAA ATPase [Skeletonema marinoi]|uniref:AAA ATPase n=1 Tax=Skeletonema marinoi TaxID=267567 RepID=A0AAD8Y1N0_9STRA|nr:putative AAA ATPase [Skeletonema marinoi]